MEINNIMDDVKITLDYEPEYDNYHQEYEKEEADMITSMLEIHGDTAWCCMKVTASITIGITELEAASYLGHCTYKSLEDFEDNSGYYEDMLLEAKEELKKELLTLLSTLK